MAILVRLEQVYPSVGVFNATGKALVPAWKDPADPMAGKRYKVVGAPGPGAVGVKAQGEAFLRDGSKVTLEAVVTEIEHTVLNPAITDPQKLSIEFVYQTTPAKLD